MPQNVSHKLIEAHLVEGEMVPGEEVGLRIDQTLTQDATGTTVMLELEAMALNRVRTELSAQYVDHNLLQTDFRNADDHLFLKSACERFGIWYSRAGNGVSHPVHMQRFGVPGKSLLGSDSHTPAAGSLGMLSFGAGGLEVALAMAGEPFYVKMPQIWGVRLIGELPPWVSAKDVILEMLRRHDVDGGVDRILEYYGPGLSSLHAMDRHVIANMGTELGATTTVFPSDEIVRRFLASQGREGEWVELVADEGASYDQEEEVDLSTLEPLIAKPSSPGNVVPVAEAAGPEIYQAYIGSSANPGLRDFAVAALMVEGRQVHPRVSLDINPSSRQILENLVEMDLLEKLIRSGARIHQAGCNGCIGMGQAPATDEISLRTVPRNFPGRSGTREDKVYLCSPETAAASAVTGRITDPRELSQLLGIEWPTAIPIYEERINTDMLFEPTAAEAAQKVVLRKGPNIVSLPHFEPLPETFHGPLLLKVEDDISTDEIMPAGNEILPYRSNIPEIARYVYRVVDDMYYERAMAVRDRGGHFLIGGANYGQGSSREHAAIAPRYLGLRVVVAKSYARIHWQNLANFGVLPLTFEREADHEQIDPGDELRLTEVMRGLRRGSELELENLSKGETYRVRHDLSERQIQMIEAGGLLQLFRQELVA